MFTGPRRAAAAVVGAVLAVVLSACAQTYTATVAPDLTVTGTYVKTATAGQLDPVAHNPLQSGDLATVQSQLDNMRRIIQELPWGAGSGYQAVGTPTVSAGDAATTELGGKINFSVDASSFVYGLQHAFAWNDSADPTAPTKSDVIPKVVYTKSGDSITFDMSSSKPFTFYGETQGGDGNTDYLLLTFPYPVHDVVGGVVQGDGKTVKFDFGNTNVSHIGAISGTVPTPVTPTVTVTATATVTAVPGPSISFLGSLTKSGSVQTGKSVKVVLPRPALAGVSSTIQWYSSGKAIKKATKASYKIPKTLKGKTLTVKVTYAGAGAAPVTLSASFGKIKK